MPIDYSKYPPNWKTEIRPAILKRAGDCCEECGVENYAMVKWNPEEKQYQRGCGNLYCDELGRGERPYWEALDAAKHWNEFEEDGKWIVIVLTVSHLDHNVQNNDPSNLKALCQRCHLNHDKELHRQNRRQTAEKKKGLQNLF